MRAAGHREPPETGEGETMSWHGDPNWALHAAFLISVPSLSASKVLPGIYMRRLGSGGR